MQWYELIQRKMQHLGPYWNEGYREFCVTYLAASGINIAGRYNYQFGINDKANLRRIYQMFRYYHLTPERIVVFDAFEGITRKTVEEFNDTLPDRGTPIEGIPIDWARWVFDVELPPEFMKTNPKSAFWVDLDVDTYIHALHILDFMFQNRLIAPQTLVSFDDWSGTEDGAGLAWKEMGQKYFVEAKEIHSFRSGEFLFKKVFIVEKTG